MSDQDIKNDMVNNDDVMISTNISNLEKILENVGENADKHTDTKFKCIVILLSLVVWVSNTWWIYDYLFNYIRYGQVSQRGYSEAQMNNNMISLVKN